MNPSLSLDELYTLTYSGIQKIGDGSDYSQAALAELASTTPTWFKLHQEMIHSVPSPSSVHDCRFKLWGRAKKIESDLSTPIGWKNAQALGIMFENYLLSVLHVSDLDVTFANKMFKCGPYMQAHPDALINDDIVLEAKAMNGFAYKKLIESKEGVRTVDKYHYTQLQLYLYATDREWGVYYAIPFDFTLIQTLMRQKKKYGFRFDLPPVYIEIIHRDDAAIANGLRRARIIHNDIQKATHPLKEYEGKEFTIDGRRHFPCGSCIFLNKCQETFETDKITFI